MIEDMIKIIEAGLSIWDSHERTKYVDRLMALKQEFYDEYNKGAINRSDAVLDNIRLKLRILGTDFAAAVGPAAPAGQPGPTGT